MKGNPADLRGLAEDLDRCINDHPDAIHHNADIEHDINVVRAKIVGRYNRISEGRDKGFDKNGDLVP